MAQIKEISVYELTLTQAEFDAVIILFEDGFEHMDVTKDQEDLVDAVREALNS